VLLRDAIVYLTCAAALAWFSEAMADALERAPAGTLAIRLFVTGAVSSDLETQLTSPSQSSTEIPDAASDGHSDNEKVNVAPASTTHLGRPVLSEIMEATFSSMPINTTVAVAACGKEEFTVDVRNGVAKAQLDIVKGTSSLAEVFLHTESFAY
jgi:hypothetical protein